MSNIIKNGSVQRRLIHNCHRSYTSITIPLNETNTTSTTTNKSEIITQAKSSSIKDILINLPSKSLIDSYRISSVFASNIRGTKEKQIKNELIILAEQKNIEKLGQVLETWSMHDINGMIETLGRDLISEYLNLMIRENRSYFVSQYSTIPVNKSANFQRLTDKLNQKETILKDQLTKQVRNIYKNMIYSSKKENLYKRDKRNDIYFSKYLTGHKLTNKDYENLMELELYNFKLDLASRWFRLFRLYNHTNWMNEMTPEMWKLAYKIDGFGDDKVWILRGTELSDYYKQPIKCRFEPSIELSLGDLQSQIQDFDLEMHTIIILHLAYKKQLTVLQKYIESIWGIDAKGDLTSPESKIDNKNHLYPDLKFLTALFTSLASNGEFFMGIKYINKFQSVYDEFKESDRDKKVFWEQIFKWANINTMFEEDRALRFFLNKSNYSRGNTISLDDAKNDVNFDYEGYLQFMEKLKLERFNTFDQIWNIVKKDPPVNYSNFIYKTYLDVLQEQKDEMKIFDFLNRLLYEYERHNVDSKSFTERQGSGFYPSNDKCSSIRVLYSEAMRCLIDLKGENTYIGQIYPLIEKYSIDNLMKNDLKKWVKTERIDKYRKQLEFKRENFMNELKNEEEEESLLELM
ncbi:hypothetical protein KGF54_003781 [Candida jiufengensis]|uniref:uncharacterized protein n=1 Tax=Candida jiufengensis TaxID=497108 RepID=UPI0022250300|nr:uncharacterized protein KGF54_003781 [Candida jiufengensis]KAI5952914.1 hypothetical protein KGF54_003781 [Candida jiufengensis]